MKYETNPKEWSNAKKRREPLAAPYQGGYDEAGRVFYSAFEEPVDPEPISPYSIGLGTPTIIDDPVREPDQRVRSSNASTFRERGFRDILSIFDEGVRAGAEEPYCGDTARQRTSARPAHVSPDTEAFGEIEDGSNSD